MTDDDDKKPDVEPTDAKIEAELAKVEDAKISAALAAQETKDVAEGPAGGHTAPSDPLSVARAHVPEHDHGDHDDDDDDDVEVPGELYGVLAEFESPGALVRAARKVRDAGYTEFDCYSPFPVHGIDEAMGIKRTILPLIVFAGGLAGTVGGAFLQWWMNAYDWPWNVGGKPVWSIPANVPIAYETTILLSVLTTFFGMWILNQLPQVWHPFFKLDRFLKASDDGFLLGIEAKDKRFDQARTTELLVKAGASAVEPCHLDSDPDRRKLPTFLWGVIIVTTILALIPLALIAKARATKSNQPHWHLFADMDFQPKAKSDAPFDAFGDGRANRGEIAGTIARGSRNDDTAYFYGLEAGAWLTGWPTEANVQPSDALMKRGEQRFNIYCAPCHGFDGQGHGTVPERVKISGGIYSPQNLVDPVKGVVEQPNGQLFNTISNGKGMMLPYSGQISVPDRWAIVLYVRALQRSANPGGAR